MEIPKTTKGHPRSENNLNETLHWYREEGTRH